MVKKGPCLHCGINCTPLWRNGPEEKPVLCNACGSRYKLRGTLENYLPKHASGGSNLNAKDKLSSPVLDSGGTNPSLSNSKFPSKKRSRVVNKLLMTPMEKFQQQLLTLWRSQRRQKESSTERVLLFHNMNNFVPSNEIGLGGILLKPERTST